MSLLTEHAKELVGIYGWEPYRWALFPPGNHPKIYWEVEGLVVTHRFRSGPRKGRPNFTKGDPATRKTIVITIADHEAWCRAWSERTGKCTACEGKGTMLRSWSKTDGAVYEPCKACSGSGDA